MERVNLVRLNQKENLSKTQAFDPWAKTYTTCTTSIQSRLRCIHVWKSMETDMCTKGLHLWHVGFHFESAKALTNIYSASYLLLRFSQVTYNCAWSHIEWCTWQPWTIANSVLNCEIRLRTGFGGHKDTWADLHENLLIAHSPTVGCAFCHNVKASLCHHLKLIFMSEYMKMHPRSTARVQLSLCNVKKKKSNCKKLLILYKWA